MSDYKTYDSVISSLLMHLRSKELNDGYIGLKEFCPKSKEHLCVYEVALMTAGLDDKKVAVNLPFFQYLVFRVKHWHERARFMNKGDANVNVSDVVVLAHRKLAALREINGGLGAIYDAYYTGKEIND